METQIQNPATEKTEDKNYGEYEVIFWSHAKKFSGKGGWRAALQFYREQNTKCRLVQVWHLNGKTVRTVFDSKNPQPRGRR